MKYTLLPMIYTIHQTAYEVFEDIFTVQKLQCSKQRLWKKPGVNNLNSPFMQNETGFYIYLIRRTSNLITIYHIRIYERLLQTLQRFTGKYFSSLDYNPDTTRDHSTHKRYMTFRTHLLAITILKYFDLKTSAMASPSIDNNIHGAVLFSAEKHMKCVFFIFKDNSLTLGHSAMIAKSLLTPSWRLMALEPVENGLVSSANNTGSVCLHTIHRSFT